MIGVYIVGEDDVTRHVIYRILSYCGAGRFTVLMELPASDEISGYLIDGFGCG